MPSKQGSAIEEDAAASQCNIAPSTQRQWDLVPGKAAEMKHCHDLASQNALEVLSPAAACADSAPSPACKPRSRRVGRPARIQRGCPIQMPSHCRAMESVVSLKRSPVHAHTTSHIAHHRSTRSPGKPENVTFLTMGTLRI